MKPAKIRRSTLSDRVTNYRAKIAAMASLLFILFIPFSAWAQGPANDHFADAFLLTGVSGQTTGSNLAATKEVDEPDHAGKNGGTSVWWRWIAPLNGQFALDTQGSSFDTLLAVYTDVGGMTQQVAENDDVSSDNRNSGLSFQAQAGTRYDIAVDGYYGASGDILLNWSMVIPEPSNEFADALDLPGLSGQATGSNMNASKEPGEPDHAGNPGGKSVWWRWTAPESGYFTFNTQGSNFNTLLAIYTGSGIGDLTEVASNDEDDRNVPFSVTLNPGLSRIICYFHSGTRYHIAVDGANGSSGAVVLNWRPFLPPSNDNFANALELTGLSGQATGINKDATKEPGEPDHASVVRGESVWWRWTAPETGHFVFDTSGSAFDTILAIYAGSDVTHLTEIASREEGESLIFEAQAGVQHCIAVDKDCEYSWCENSSDVVLNWQPILYFNDDFANAATLTGESGQETSSNVNATCESGEPEHASCDPRKSMWWKWTAPQTDFFTFDTHGSSFSTLLSVYTGSEMDALNEVISNINENEFSDDSSVTFHAQAGVQYSIVVDKYRDSGDITLNWKIADRPENDDFANASVLPSEPEGNVSGSSAEATKEEHEPNHSGEEGGKSVWWKWTPPETNHYFFESFGTFDPVISIYTGTSLDNLTRIADSGSCEPELVFQAQAGVQYHIAVDGWDDQYEGAGDVHLYWHIPENRPENDELANALTISGELGQANGSNDHASKETGEPDHADNPSRKSVWWTMTPLKTGYFFFGTYDSSFGTTLAVYTGADLDHLTEVTSNDDGREDGRDTRRSNLIFQAQAGIQYHIAVDGDDGCDGQIVLNWESLPSVPSADDIEDALEFTGLTGQAIASNADATKEEDDEPDHANAEGGKSVWWKWKALESDYFSFDTHGSSFDTLLAVYTIPPDEQIDVDYLTEVAANDNDGSPSGNSGLTFEAQVGESYYVVVDGAYPYFGDIVLNWHMGTPNDAWAHASELTGVSGQTSGSNLGATKETGEQNHAGNSGGTSVWWSWTALRDDHFTFDTHGCAFDTLLAVYTGSDMGSLTEIASNDDDEETGENTSRLEFEAQEGVRYHIVVDGKNGQSGDVVLNWIFAADRHVYEFERMWPALKQPWYFISPRTVGTDEKGFVYVLDTYRIQKYTSDGQFIAKWGDFYGPQGVTVDRNGFVYVADTLHHCIQKFTSDGRFVAKWGDRWGSEDGQFAAPSGIMADNDFVYVVDRGNDRIQKFTSDGAFVTKWKTCASGEQMFSSPYGIAMDNSGLIYVVVSSSINYNIKKFTSDGELVAKWGVNGMGDGEFRGPEGIAIDSKDFVYVADNGNHRIQKFTTDGQFLAKWGSYGVDNGEFMMYSCGVAVDGDGFVYVADMGNGRIQKLTPDGSFVAKWGSRGSEAGKLYKPQAIRTEDGFVYVDDTGNDRVQKFTLDGQPVPMETGEDVFADHLYTSATDSDGFVYTTKDCEDCVRKFDPDGQLVTKWGTQGSGDGEFEASKGIAVDKDGSVYVVDRGNHRIQKFTSGGQFITKFGEFGSNPGQLNSPVAVAVSEDGRVYVSDFGNNRVQVFKPTLLSDKKTKAIIVAGGGPYEGNTLWEATQMSANFAYRTLTYQGFTKETIYYLSSDTDLDLDSNGEPDDVDADATNENLQQAITEWAADADSLVIYLTDHGGTNIFRMSGSELLLGYDLDSWLDTFQADVPEAEDSEKEVILIYDACYSGSFLNLLTPVPDRKRITITSASADEVAFFISQGTISFSNYFWTHVFNGYDVSDAFTLARSSLESPTAFQHPLLDGNSNGIGNEADDLISAQDVYIGNGTEIYTEIPRMESVSWEAGEEPGTARLIASGVTDNDGIAGVRAVIWPPGYDPELSGSAIQDFPGVDLMPVKDEPGRYENLYGGFHTEETYRITIYAKDRAGNTSAPKLLSVRITNPLRHRAIILAGDPSPAEVKEALWPAIRKNSVLAYDTLKFQGYSDEDIFFMSPVAFSSGWDSTPTWDYLKSTIETWAGENTEDVVLFMTGNEQDGTLQLNDTETLSPQDMDAWLDKLQETLPGKVVVVYDASCSGEFLSALTTPEGKERILISSATGDQPASFIGVDDETISFSQFFWKSISEGSTISDAFLQAKRAVRYLGRRSGTGQVPGMYDNDGLAQDAIIGNGIMTAGDEPLIGTVAPSQRLNGEVSAEIWVERVTTTGTIAKVFAVIIPPASDSDSSDPLTHLPSLALTDAGDGQYGGTHSGFSDVGVYQIAIYAMDERKNISLPAETQVEQTIAPEPSELLWVSVTIDGPARLTMHAPDGKTCGKETCDIPEADVDLGESGEQVVSLAQLTEGDYRLMLHGATAGESLMTVSIYQGTEILREEVRTVSIEAHQTLKTMLSISADRTVTMGEPEIPATSDGKPLFYDFDGNGTIDEGDIERVSSRWNTEPGDPGYDPFYDLDDDGWITILDIMRVVNSKAVP